MSERNDQGFYTAEMLRGGMRDQYAVVRKRGVIKVELHHIPGGARPWVVSSSTTSEEDSLSAESAFKTLDEARREYRRLVRKNP